MGRPALGAHTGAPLRKLCNGSGRGLNEFLVAALIDRMQIRMARSNCGSAIITNILSEMKDR